MKITPIKNEKDYQKALQELEKVFDADLNTPAGDIGQILVLLIEDYEKNIILLKLPTLLKPLNI